jgi:hypothetical protein
MGFTMGKDDNIYVKLVLDVHFDKTAPNFHIDKDMISWCPTVEEIGFINDSIQKISQHYWNAADATTSIKQPTTTTTSDYTTPKNPTPTTPTPTPPTTLPRFTPPPSTTTTTEKDTDKTTPPIGSTRESTVDMLLKRKKGEKDEKVAFVP